jgi:hypothetical protein
MPRGYGNDWCCSQNETCDLPAKNPQPQNAMSNDTGNAGLDGYSCLSRASRRTGVRPAIGVESEYPVSVLYPED